MHRVIVAAIIAFLSLRQLLVLLFLVFKFVHKELVEEQL